MINSKYMEVIQQKKNGKKTFTKFLHISSYSIFLSFLLPVSITTASIDIAETMIEVKQISLPLLFVSFLILLFAIARLLEYRRVIEKKTEALRESEERYALAAQGANDGLWDWNLKTNEIYFSPRWKSMSGYNNNEIGNSSNDWFTLVHPDDVDNLKNAITAHLKEPNAPIENEHRIKHKDGTYLWMLCRGMAVIDKTGKVVRMAGSQTDITARKKMEEQLIYDAFHDGLTGLPNRALFLDRLSVSFARRKRRKDYHFAV
ncbi:MAG: PAS domain S-box protein, partial [Nitrospira sp.]|nr:PAS domain S-box protein [Nitrospira sp.]